MTSVVNYRMNLGRKKARKVPHVNLLKGIKKREELVRRVTIVAEELKRRDKYKDGRCGSLF